MRESPTDLSTLRKSSAELYQALIAPLEDRLVAGRTLVFEPDGFLEAVPWEALVNARGRYICQDFPTVVAPGLYRSLDLRPATAINSASPAIVVSVPNVPGLASLPDADREAEAVKHELPWARWLQDAAATIPAVEEQMHGAGVGLTSPDMEWYRRGGAGFCWMSWIRLRNSVLVLDGQSFRAEDMQQRLQLVVLSACHTGAQPEPGTSGAEGLAQEFLHHGVPHVVVTRWNIDSSKTAELYMKQFYTRLLNGADTASAMQSAQLLLASQPESVHPYYWAAFQLEGTK